MTCEQPKPRQKATVQKQKNKIIGLEANKDTV
jgi:hypothetical protein